MNLTRMRSLPVKVDLHERVRVRTTYAYGKELFLKDFNMDLVSFSVSLIIFFRILLFSINRYED